MCWLIGCCAVTMNAYVVADTRERAVIPDLVDLLGDQVVVSQINTGDYLICAEGGRVLACVERKTYADFAASFCDGRYANFDKMISLRNETACDLYCILEGPTCFYKPTALVSGIPYRAIDSAVMKLTIRDNFRFILAKDAEHTAQRLMHMLNVYVSLGGIPKKLDTNADMQCEARAVPSGGRAVPSGVMGLIKKDDDEIIASMWSALEGVSVIQGRVIAKTVGSFENFFRLRQLPEIKQASGRNLSAVARKAINSLHRSLAPDRHVDVQVLAKITGISPATADAIVRQCGNLQHITDIGCEAVAAVQLQQKSRLIKLGNAKAERIVYLLKRTAGDPLPAAAAPPMAAPPTAAPPTAAAVNPLLIAAPIEPTPITAELADMLADLMSGY